jgi:hypothetical protein
MAESKPDRESAGHRLTESFGEHIEPGDQPGGHVEPREVSSEPRGALGSPCQQRYFLTGLQLTQAPGPQCAGRGLGGSRAAGVLGADRVTWTADTVARPEHIEHEPSSIEAEHFDHECSA